MSNTRPRGRRGSGPPIGCVPAVIPGRPSAPLDDMLPLPADRRAKSAAGEAVSLFILETPSRDVKKASAAPVRGEDWVKVPLHPGDSLAKLALKYGMSVAQLKAANGILGSTIPVWDDEIWLPPLAIITCHTPTSPQSASAGAAMVAAPSRMGWWIGW